MALPRPEAGLVLSYAYLWRQEQRDGQVEGRKDRPCIILAVETLGDRRRVTLVPITHSPPHLNVAAVELPVRVKAHLGLDDLPSWIILNEANQFFWPGFDIRQPRPGMDSAYGYIPPNLLLRINTAFLAEARAGHLKLSNRD